MVVPKYGFLLYAISCSTQLSIQLQDQHNFSLIFRWSLLSGNRLSSAKVVNVNLFWILLILCFFLLRPFHTVQFRVYDWFVNYCLELSTITQKNRIQIASCEPAFMEHSMTLRFVLLYGSLKLKWRHTMLCDWLKQAFLLLTVIQLLGWLLSNIWFIWQGKANILRFAQYRFSLAK